MKRGKLAAPTLADVAQLRVYTGRAGVCQVLAATICGRGADRERQGVSSLVLLAQQRAAVQQQRHVLLPHQPGVGAQDPQQAAHAQTLHALPPGAQAAPDGGEGVPRR